MNKRQKTDKRSTDPVPAQCYGYGKIIRIMEFGSGSNILQKNFTIPADSPKKVNFEVLFVNNRSYLKNAVTGRTNKKEKILYLPYVPITNTQ
jgi:hypothetical protein